MTMEEYLERELKNPLNQEIAAELDKIAPNDKEYLVGTLLDVEHEDDKRALLDFIHQGIEVNKTQIIIESVWLYQQRHPEEFEHPEE